MANISENVKAIRASISAVTSNPVEIMAVTKYHTVDEINQLMPTEIRTIGENKVQDFVAKLPMIDPAFNPNIIGQLQRNKVKYIIDKVSMIQSLDRVELAQEIDRQAKLHGVTMNVLIQVNLAREAQKGGVYIEDYDELIRTCQGLTGLKVKGLMAVMPDVSELEEIRPLFRQMRTLFERERDAARDGIDMQVLSMGMSHDYLMAAEEGATMVRIGRAIFQ